MSADNSMSRISLAVIVTAIIISISIATGVFSVSAQEDGGKGGDLGGGWGGGGFCDNGGGWAAAAADKGGAIESGGWGWGGEGGSGAGGGGGGGGCSCGTTIECGGTGETGTYCWNVCWPCPPTPPPPTSAPTTPRPSVSVAANPKIIPIGATSLITWSSTNATSCMGFASPADTTFATGGSTGSSDSVSPTANTTYTVQCTGPGGTASASDSVSIRAPRCSDGVDNDGDGSSDASDPGCRTNPSDSSTYNSRDDDEGAGPTPLSLNIEATPRLIEQGDTSSLNWTSSNAVSCQVTGTGNGGSWSGLSATNQQTNALNQTTVFTLQCHNVDNQSMTDSVTVRINPRVIEE